MTFEPEQNKIQTSLGGISYQFFDPKPNGDEQRTADFSIQILDQNGDVMQVKTGEMIQHMLPAEIQIIQDLLDAWRLRAQGVLPS